MNQTEAGKALFQRPGFRAYLGVNAFTGVANSMQQLLISWLLVGILLLPADRVGLVQAVIGIPGIFFMLIGGATADRVDPRTLLMRAYFCAWLIPLFLAAATGLNALNIWTVALFGVGMSTVNSFTNPAQQSILNRVAVNDVQRGVSSSTAIGFMMQIIGLGLAGQMETIGVIPVLATQGICFLIGAFMVRRISPEISATTEADQPLWKVVGIGLRATYENKTILQTLSISMASGIFNAGAFVTVTPFIVKRVYEGNALSLAIIMMVFYAGAALSNFLMLKLMPFNRPGRVFLAMQLTRAVVVALLWIGPPLWIFMFVVFAWGMNMGVTTTLARTIVQESASPQFRGRILSVFSLGMMGTMPVGALILGFIIEAFGTLNALIPAIAISIVLFTFGVSGSQVWRYQSPRLAS